MDALLAIVEVPEFQRNCERLLAEAERDALYLHLANNPKAGVVVQNAGGVRKLRWAARGKGKRGGVRVIYYFHNYDMPLVMFDVYLKAEKSDLTADEKKHLRKVVPLIVEQFFRRRK